METHLDLSSQTVFQFVEYTRASDIDLTNKSGLCFLVKGSLLSIYYGLLVSYGTGRLYSMHSYLKVYDPSAFTLVHFEWWWFGYAIW